jgi:hypothetical protein
VWCPSCGAEYRPGFTRCPDCDVDLVDELPPEPEVEPERQHEQGFDVVSELVEAYSGSRIDTELIRSVLEGSGVPVALWGTGSSYMPETGAALSAVRVMVRPSDLERAREVIDAAGVGDLDLDPSGGTWEDPEYYEDADEDSQDALDAAPGWDPAIHSTNVIAGEGQPEPFREFVPWYSTPWGRVVMGVIALGLAVALVISVLD